jgi:hypothetical protein
MKGVTGGINWTIIGLIVGMVAIALLILFTTTAGKAVSSMFSGLVDSFAQLVCTIVGRIPLIGIFMKC